METHGREGGRASKGTSAGRECVSERFNGLSFPEVQYVALQNRKRKFLLQSNKTQLFSTVSDVEKDAGFAINMYNMTEVTRKLLKPRVQPPSVNI